MYEPSTSNQNYRQTTNKRENKRKSKNHMSEDEVEPRFWCVICEKAKNDCNLLRWPRKLSERKEMALWLSNPSPDLITKLNFCTWPAYICRTHFIGKTWDPHNAAPRMFLRDRSCTDPVTRQIHLNYITAQELDSRSRDKDVCYRCKGTEPLFFTFPDETLPKLQRLWIESISSSDMQTRTLLELYLRRAPSSLKWCEKHFETNGERLPIHMVDEKKAHPVLATQKWRRDWIVGSAEDQNRDIKEEEEDVEIKMSDLAGNSDCPALSGHDYCKKRKTVKRTEKIRKERSAISNFQEEEDIKLEEGICDAMEVKEENEMENVASTSQREFFHIAIGETVVKIENEEPIEEPDRTSYRIG